MIELARQLRDRIGRTLCSDWLQIDQAMIDRFADATFDHQYIHVDAERARQSPFGGTIAHGFLTLSLLHRLRGSAEEGMPLDGVRMGVNYGFERLRFLNPVRSNARIRGCFTISNIDERDPGRFRILTDVVVEIESEDRPALSCEWITMIMADERKTA